MIVDYFAELGGRAPSLSAVKDIDEVTTRYHILVATGHKKDKETGADALREQWGKKSLRVTFHEPENALWQPIADPVPDLTILPPYSFSLRFRFTLAQPYLSKDDNAFYIVDNPIVRDKVFRLPMVRPSSWKGSLRAAMWQLGYRKESDDESVQRLFGDIRGGDKGQAGRLRFFPTFFTKTGLEIINPHDRKTKVGKKPILFECVPHGADGAFTLLYVSFDRIGKEVDETRRQAAKDLKVVAKAIEAMFTVYGFGAKTSSGFGCAEDKLSEQGSLSIAAPALKLQFGRTPEEGPPVKPEIPDAVRQFCEKHPDEDFTLKPNKWRKQRRASQKERNRYQEAKAVYQAYQQALKSYNARLEDQDADRLEDDRGLFAENFSTLAELTSLATSISNALKEGTDI